MADPIRDALCQLRDAVIEQFLLKDGWRPSRLVKAMNEAESLLTEPFIKAPADGQLTDKQLLALMPQQFRDDLATVSRLASYGTPMGPGVYRVTLNTGALAFARAVLAAQPPATAVDPLGAFIAAQRPMDPEVAAAVAPETRWDLYDSTQPPAPALVPTFLDAIRLAHGCHDYSGGYVGDGAEAFHAGISTVEVVLRKAAAGLWDHQTSAVFAAGSEPPAQSPADEPAVPEGREPAAVAVEASPTATFTPAAGEGEGEAVPTIDDIWDLCEKYDFRLGVDGTDEEEGAEILRDIILTALARWGRPATQPTPPAGEAEELAAALEEDAECAAIEARMTADQMRRAAALLRQLSAAQALQPVAVSERLPKPGIKVLAHYLNPLGKGRTICAIWVPAKTRSDSYGDDDFTEYDEETDAFYWPEGWYEAIENWEDLGYVKVDDGEVIYWQPLPQWPAHALPLPTTTPAGEEGADA